MKGAFQNIDHFLIHNLITICLALGFGNFAFSQDRAIVKAIVIEGNKQTKRTIILRELSFDQGDTIETNQLQSRLDRAEERLFNLQLFNKIEITYEQLSQPSEVFVFITVEERWYTWPVLVFDLIDRNFNHWWVNENRDLSRTEYGIKFYRFNMFGLNHRLRLTLQDGFTRTLGFEYKIPYLGKKQQLGMEVDLEYLTNQTLIYENQGHIQQNLLSDETLYRRFYGYLTFRYRPSFYTTHSLNLGYVHKQVSDTVAQANSDFFLNGRTQQVYPYLYYSLVNDLRDFAYYPLKGSLTKILVEQSGLGFSDLFLSRLSVSYAHYLPLSKNIFYAGLVDASVSLPEKQPYTHFRALGFGENLVRGYELYVIEGQHYTLTRHSLRWRFINHEFNLGRLMPIKQFRKVPLATYLKVFSDAGYAYRSNPAEDTFLANELLYSAGLGLDITTFYDIVVRLEGSYTSQNRFRFAFTLGADIN